MLQVYGDLSADRLERGIIVTPTNDAVRDLNRIILQKLPGQQMTFFCKTTIEYGHGGAPEGTDAPDPVPGLVVAQEELDGVHASNIPPAQLHLKVGCMVMLLMNLDRKNGLCNGTRLVVKQILKESIKVQRAVPFRGRREEIFLPKLRMLSDDVPVAGTISRFQIPVSLAFAVSINKAQGQSMEYVGLYLRRPVFSHGQFFVAVSRGKKGRNVHIAVVKGPLQGPLGQMRGGRSVFPITRTKNIVIKSLL